MKNYINSIALFGTSADPPTHGHEAILKGLSTIFPQVVTWASDNPTKKHAEPLEIRCQLLKALVDDLNIPEIKIVQDISNPLAIITLEKAYARWPQSNMVFIIGSDLTEDILTWIEIKDLLKKARIGIAIREGWPVKNKHLKNIKLMGGNIDVLPLKIPDSSSSAIRKAFQLSEIPKSVVPLLINNNLYGLKRGEQ